MREESNSPHYSLTQYINWNSLSSGASYIMAMGLGYSFGGDYCKPKEDQCSATTHKLYALSGMAVGFFVQRGISYLKYQRAMRVLIQNNDGLKRDTQELISSFCTTYHFPAAGLIQQNLNLYHKHCLNPIQTPQLTLQRAAHSNTLLKQFKQSLQQFIYDAEDTSETMLESCKKSFMKLFTEPNEEIEKALCDEKYMGKLISKDDFDPSYEAAPTLN